ncbi:hypothetical protein BD779DRAFT_318350 [Infundibulicybe gibba]|nr:hypothetical protein BD779DRAFT_318350 [Infundibulicybe gibba]
MSTNPHNHNLHTTSYKLCQYTARRTARTDVGATGLGQCTSPGQCACPCRYAYPCQYAIPGQCANPYQCASPDPLYALLIVTLFPDADCSLSAGGSGVGGAA